MKDETTLREKARKAIQSGKLPAMKPSRTWGGPGDGTPCSVCGEPVTQGQMELEIGYRRDNGKPGLDSYFLHVKCFAAWECESQDQRAETAISSNGSDSVPLPPRLSAAPWETD
jgi:hypothetical protein